MSITIEEERKRDIMSCVSTLHSQIKQVWALNWAFDGRDARKEIPKGLSEHMRHAVERLEVLIGEVKDD